MLKRIYTSKSTGLRTVVRYKGIMRVVVEDSIGRVEIISYPKLFKEMGLIG